MLAREAVERGLAAAGAGVGDIRRLLVTHVHYDHVGQASELRRAGAREWWLGKAEVGSFTGLVTDPRAQRQHRVDDMIRYGGRALTEQGYTAADAPADPLDWDAPDRWAVDGDVADLADGELEVIDTPGHTVGHQCFLHRGRRLLFAGDHVLPHITPSIGLEGVVNRQSLADFMASLARVRNLDVDLVLPAHGEPFADLAGRVDALLTHHEVRLDACASAVRDRLATAYEVAQRLGWTRRQTPFTELDLFNKVLATWETAAHLELLSARGTVGRHDDGDVIAFGPVDGSPPRPSPTR